MKSSCLKLRTLSWQSLVTKYYLNLSLAQLWLWHTFGNLGEVCSWLNGWKWIGWRWALSQTGEGWEGGLIEGELMWGWEDCRICKKEIFYPTRYLIRRYILPRADTAAQTRWDGNEELPYEVAAEGVTGTGTGAEAEEPVPLPMPVEMEEESIHRHTALSFM